MNKAHIQRIVTLTKTLTPLVEGNYSAFIRNIPFPSIEKLNRDQLSLAREIAALANGNMPAGETMKTDRDSRDTWDSPMNCSGCVHYHDGGCSVYDRDIEEIPVECPAFQ